MFPLDLIDAIKSEYPPYKEIEPKYQKIIASMLWLWTNPSYRHENGSDSLAFPKKLVRDFWDSDKTMYRILGINYFSVSIGSNFSKEASAFTPFPYMLRALVKCLENQKKESLSVSIPKTSIRSLTGENDDKKQTKSKWTGINVINPVPLNINSLEIFASQTKDPIHLIASLKLLKLSRNKACFGKVPIQYEQKTTGRITEMLSGLQSNPREVTRAAFAGCWDYDISNCHFAIISSWGEKLGIESPVINHYLSNKKKIRHELAKTCLPQLKTDEAIKLIKKSLLSLVYGAPLNYNEEKTSLGKTLGKQGAKIFTNTIFVKDLTKEIRKLGSAIIDDLDWNSGRYGNHMGIFVSDKKTSKELLSHALQGAEALALKTILSHFGRHILLCMHDGWVSEKRLNKALLERLICEATDLNLEVEEVQIPIPIQTRIHENKPDELLKININQLVINKDILKGDRNTLSGLVVSTRPRWNRPSKYRGGR